MTYDIKALRDLEKRLAKATVDSAGILAVAEASLGDVAAPLLLRAAIGTSLDAAVALVKRVLPGWRIFFTYTLGSGVCQLRLIDVTGQEPRDDEDWPFTKGCAATPALALCLACVRALIAQEEAA